MTANPNTIALRKLTKDCQLFGDRVDALELLNEKSDAREQVLKLKVDLLTSENAKMQSRIEYLEKAAGIERVAELGDDDMQEGDTALVDVASEAATHLEAPSVSASKAAATSTMMKVSMHMNNSPVNSPLIALADCCCPIILHADRYLQDRPKNTSQRCPLPPQHWGREHIVAA